MAHLFFEYLWPTFQVLAVAALLGLWAIVSLVLAQRLTKDWKSPLTLFYAVLIALAVPLGVGLAIVGHA